MIEYVTVISFQYLKLVWLYEKYKRMEGRKRLIWVKPHIRDHVRDVFGAYNALLMEFYFTDHEQFFRMTRMSPEQFDMLHNIVGIRLIKTSLRRPLPSRLGLAPTLSYLAHGDSVQTTSFLFRVGYSTTHQIIAEVCNVLWDLLSPIYLRRKTAQDWRLIAQGFRVRWNFPNCIGAMDGKEIAIEAPPHSGSLYFNYKKFHSFKLMAMCDSYYRFTWVDIGDYGAVSDISAFQNTDFYKALENSEADLPPNARLPRSQILMQYFFVCNEIFQLKPYVIRPISRRNALSKEEAYFNYRLSRARQCIEVAFGILAGRWRVMHTILSFKLKTSIAIVQAVVCLQNFILNEELPLEEVDQQYAPPGRFEPHVPFEGPSACPEHGDIVEEGQNEEAAIAPDVLRQRQLLMQYFVSEAGAPI